MIHLAGARHKGNRVALLELCVKNVASGDEASSDVDSRDKDNSDEDSVGLNDGADESKVRISLGSFNIPMMMTNGGFDDYRLCAVLVEHGHEEGLADLEDVPRALLICICAEHGFVKAISRLLELGKISGTIRRFGVRPFGWTALHLAACVGNVSLVEELRSHGWSLTDEDSLGRSVLDLAAYSGHVELVQILLAAHCIAEHRDRDGLTPLHYAVSGAGGKDCCRLLECLVAAGCDVSKASASGETALHWAARFNRDAAAAWLLERGSPASATDGYLNTPLHVAACSNAVTVIKALLSHGAQVNRAAVDGRTPLHCASRAGAGDAATALLDAGADPNQTDIRGHTALVAAIYWGACEFQTIDVLLKCTKVDWTASHTTHPVAIAALAVKSPNRAPALGRVIEAMRATAGEKVAHRIIKRLLPELVSEILVCADDTDRGSPADVIPLLLDFLPENGRTRHIALFHMLLAVIKHSGDDGQLTRRLLLLDESNVTQAIPGNWGMQHLCCRYGKLKQLRVFLGLGLLPFSRSVIDGVTCTSEGVARKFSPRMLPQFESLIEGAHVLGRMCRRDPTVFPMLRRVLTAGHFAREIVDLSDPFKRDSEEEGD